MATAHYIADHNGNYTFPQPLHADQIVSLAASILESRLVRGDAYSKPADAGDYLRLQLGELEHEEFAVMFLDTRHRLISFDVMFTGTIDSASVHPREVVKRALQHNAAAIICAHNHPSGVAEPSAADQALTRRLKDALGLIDIRVLDHFVVSASEHVSMSERGMI